ncbi:MAG: DUF11 domain-containing protein [Gemmataceae bacterium]|nr:DUF11 domain-containing protein [Gemmataceae bacterium]
MKPSVPIRIAGWSIVLWVCVGVVPGPRLEGHADAFPFGMVHLVPLPAIDGPCEPPAPWLTLKMLAPACAAAGREIEYRYIIENCSAGDAHHVLVKNPLPANVRYVRASPVPHQLEPELQWKLGTVKGGGKCEISVVVLPLGPADVRNCVRIQCEHGLCTTTRLAPTLPWPFDPSRPPPLEPRGEPPRIEPKIEPIPLEGLARLKLRIEGPKDRYANMPARYFITVVNEGKAPATNLLVRALLPEKTEFVEASHEGHHLAGQVAWLLRDLEAGGKRTVELILRSQGAGERCLRASALADRGVTAPQEEFCTIFKGISALLLEMYDREDPVVVGGDTSYPIVVENTGSAPVTNLRIRARVPPHMVLVNTIPAERTIAERTPQGQWYSFPPVPSLAPGAKAEFQVSVKAVTTGDARFRIEMTADQLDAARGPVFEEESTLVYDEEAGKLPGLKLSRKKRSRTRCSSRRPQIRAKSSQHLVQIGRDRYFVVEEVLQPQIVVLLGDGDQRQQIAQTHSDRGSRHYVIVGRRFGIHSQIRGHAPTSLCGSRNYHRPTRRANFENSPLE